MKSSTYTMKEFLMFCSMPTEEIIRMAHKHDARRCGQLSCEMKKAMATYSKTNKKMDNVKLNYLTVQAKLEKWARKYFKKERLAYYHRLGYDNDHATKFTRNDWQECYQNYWRF